MKKHLTILVAAVTFLALCQQADAQQLELYSGSASLGSGPSVAPQTATFFKNVARSTTFTTQSPAITVTASLSNQRYAPIAGLSASPGVNFAGYNGFGWSIFNPITFISSSATNAQYTSAANAAAGTNYDVANNYGFDLDINSAFWKPSPGANRATNFRESFADLTLTFSQTVLNPVIHLADLGAASSGSSTVNGVTTSYGLGAYAELELVTPGLTLTKLSGSTHFILDATNTKILNDNAAQSMTDGNVYISQSQGGGGGSVKINTTAMGINSVTFRLFLKGTGGIGTPGPPTSAQWGLVEEFYVSASLEIASLLPVKLVSFTGGINNCATILNWKSAEEPNLSRYQLEYSTDGIKFAPVADINSKGDNSLYTATHTPQQGQAFYRLKMIDKDGKFEYSNIVAVFNNCSRPQVSIYPNPATRFVTIAGAAEKSTIEVYDMTGKLLLQQKAMGSGIDKLDIDRLGKSVYIIKIMGVDGTVINKKLSKQ